MFFQLLKLQDNRISKLTNSSFVIYPKIKELLLSDNVVHTIESGALTVLDELELLDLSGNALQEAPVGLPASLVHLNLNKNPVKHMERLSRAVGLQVLKLSNCDLGQYPALGVMPNLVELDVSNNELLDDLDPVKLAATCRLTRLDVTGCTALFQGPESRCRCLRVVEWTQTYKIRVLGMPPCPAAEDGGDADNCTATAATDEARAVFKNCMVEWEHRNTPYWAIGLGLVIAVAVLLALCVCLRRRKRRHHTDKVQSVPATDTKENNDSTATGNKSEPAALLSSP